MSEATPIQLQMPEGDLAVRLRKKLEEYLKRWNTVVGEKDNRYKAPEYLKALSGDWYAWFILDELVRLSSTNSSQLYTEMMEETANGMDEEVFWRYVRIIANYSTLGHSGEEFGNKPLPTIE